MRQQAGFSIRGLELFPIDNGVNISIILFEEEAVLHFFTGDVSHIAACIFAEKL